MARVAVYLDFDNIVISRYDQVMGATRSSGTRPMGSSSIPERLDRATVDVGAIIDFASSFGTLVLTRAYADWSADVNAGYRGQLVARAVDLVQLFPAAAYGKNGADIRLAVDAVEDMFRLPDLTHVVIVAGDSDYIPLAQRCKRLGRYVVGIGVAGSSSRALAAACDEFVIYDALPGVPVFEPEPAGRRPRRGQRRNRTAAARRPSARSRRATRPAGRRHRAPDARAADRSREGRRRLAAQLRRESANEADGPVVQRKVFGIPVIQRLPAFAVRRRRIGREFDDPDGAACAVRTDVSPTLTAVTREAIRPRRSWPGWLTRNVRVLSGVSFLQDTASELLYPLLPIYLTAVLGAPPSVVGAIEGVAEGAASLTNSRRARWATGSRDAR